MVIPLFITHLFRSLVPLGAWPCRFNQLSIGAFHTLNRTKRGNACMYLSYSRSSVLRLPSSANLSPDKLYQKFEPRNLSLFQYGTITATSPLSLACVVTASGLCLWGKKSNLPAENRPICTIQYCLVRLVRPRPLLSCLWEQQTKEEWLMMCTGIQQYS